MTVAQLIEALKRMPQDATVIVDQHSDYTDELSGPTIISAVPQGGYIMRVPRYGVGTMRDEDIRRVSDYVHIG